MKRVANLAPHGRRSLACLAALALLHTPTTAAAEGDGAYGRLAGDLGLSLELGVSEALGGEAVAGESLAVRTAAIYLHTVGLAAQYNDALGAEVAPLARSVVGTLELRPLFLGRFAQDMERGPAHLDLFVDSFALGLGVYASWWREALCGGAASCTDHGMELALGFELPLLPRASSPFLALRGALRWSLLDPAPFDSALPERPRTTGMLTLTLGYRHLFEVHLVDASDTLPK